MSEWWENRCAVLEQDGSYVTIERAVRGTICCAAHSEDVRLDYSQCVVARRDPKNKCVATKMTFLEAVSLGMAYWQAMLQI